MSAPQETSSILPTYIRAPVEFVRGEGAWLVASDGSRYLDFGAGIAVAADSFAALETRVEAEGRLTWAQVQSALDLVALYKALGGGWEPYQQVQLPDYSVFGDAPRG